MRLTFLKSQLCYASLATRLALSYVRMTLARVETIEPNPTQPFDIDTDFGYGPSGGGSRFGRGPAWPGQPSEENSVETMLRDIEGTNYGRCTGHAIGTAPRGAQPENRLRYRFYCGRRWYWTQAHRWSYFDGRRWMPYSPP